MAAAVLRGPLANRRACGGEAALLAREAPRPEEEIDHQPEDREEGQDQDPCERRGGGAALDQDVDDDVRDPQHLERGYGDPEDVRGGHRPQASHAEARLANDGRAFGSGEADATKDATEVFAGLAVLELGDGAALEVLGLFLEDELHVRAKMRGEREVELEDVAGYQGALR